MTLRRAEDERHAAPAPVSQADVLQELVAPAIRDEPLQGRRNAPAAAQAPAVNLVPGLMELADGGDRRHAGERRDVGSRTSSQVGGAFSPVRIESIAY